MICSYCGSKGELSQMGQSLFHEDCFDVYRKKQYLDNVPFADSPVIEIREDAIREAIGRRVVNPYPIQGHEICCGQARLKHDLKDKRIRIDSLIPLGSINYFPPNDKKDTYFEISSDLEEELKDILAKREVKGFFHFHDLPCMSDSIYVAIFGLLANEPERLHTKVQVAFHQAFMKNLVLTAHQSGVEGPLFKMQGLEETIKTITPGYTPEFFKLVENNKLVSEVKSKTLDEIESRDALARYTLAQSFFGDFTDVLDMIVINDTSLSTLKKQFGGLKVLAYLLSEGYEKDVIRQIFLVTSKRNRNYRVMLV